MFIGQARAGKTSLIKSLKGEAFDVNEGSTIGIEVDPAYFKVSKEIWKTGEMNQKTCPESDMSFECRAAAQFIFKSLKEEENVINVPESFLEEQEIAFGLDLEQATETVTNGTNGTKQMAHPESAVFGCGAAVRCGGRLWIPNIC